MVRRLLLALCTLLLGTAGTLVAPAAARAADATLTLGTATTVSVDAGGTARLSFTAGPSGQVELFFDTAVFGDPTFTGTSRVDVEAADGTIVQTAFVDVFGPNTVTVQGPAGADYVAVVTDESGSGLTVGLLPVASVLTTTSATLPFDGDLTAAHGEDLALTVPVNAGDRVAFTVTASGLVDVPAFGAPLAVAVDDGTGTPLGAALDVADGASVVVQGGVQADGVARLVLTLRERTSGTVHVTAGAPAAPAPLAALGQPTVATVSTPGETPRFSFTATAGEPFGLLVKDIAFTGSDTEPQVSVVVTRPDGGFAGAAFVTQGQGDVLLENPTTLTTGTWTVEVDPVGDAVGTLTLVRIHPRTTTSALVLGRTVPLAFPDPGDAQRLTFTSGPGRRLTLLIPDRTLDAQITVLDPDGSVVGDIGAGISTDYYEFDRFPVDGTYTLVVDPVNAGTGTLSLRADLVTDPVRTTTVGRRTTVSWTTGQNPRLRFTVRAGERIALDLGATVPADAQVVPSVLTPAGDPVPLVGDGTPDWLESFAPVAVGGTFTLVLDPLGAVAGSRTLTVRTATDVVLPGRLGRTTDVTVTRPAQNVVLPFEATPGRRGGPFVQWRVQSSTLGPVLLRLVDPTGFAVETLAVPAGGGRGTFTVPLSVAGGWRVEVDPPGRTTGSASVRISLVDKA